MNLYTCPLLFVIPSFRPFAKNEIWNINTCVMCGIHQLDWETMPWECYFPGVFKTFIMTDQATMQLNQVSLSKNVECTLYLTIVLFTAKTGLTGSS